MNVIEQAIGLKAELDALRPISGEQEKRIMQKFRLDWNYHSNNLEGNSLTYGETKALIMFGLTAQGKPLQDHLEIEGHNEAIEHISEIVKGDYPLTETLIRQIHKLLLKKSYSVSAITPDGLPTTKVIEVGKYKTLPNHVKTVTGEIFYFASPEETPFLMTALVEWYREKAEDPTTNPLLLGAEFHYRFIRIHPFDDGNGRTARILMNFILMKFGFPPVIIKTEEKRDYFSALQLADSGVLSAFVEHIAKNLVWSLEIMIRGAKGESIEENDDLDKELALLEARLNKNKSQIEKNQAVILDLFDNSIVPLFQKYYVSLKKFEKFYIKTTFYFQSTQTSSHDLNIALNRIRPLIDDTTVDFDILTHFETFRYADYGNFDFFSQLSIMLGPNSYFVIAYDKKTLQEKNYGEQLLEEEIEDFVKHELQRHKQFIYDKTK